MTDTGTSIELAFPVTDTGSAALMAAVPALPDTPADNFLATQATAPATRQTLVCHVLLRGETLQKANEDAAKLLPEILQNSQVLAELGSDALAGVNRLIDDLLHGKEPVNLPEVEALMKSLSRDMRDLNHKYDPQDAKNIQKYEKARGRILSLFHLGKTFLEEFLDDVRSMESRFDKAIKTLTGKQLELVRNIAYYDEYYKLNEEEIKGLIYSIAVMELIRDLAAQEADKVVVGNGDLGDRGGEQKAKLAEIVSLMDTKIAAFKGRLWVAWAMSPQVRMMRTLNLGLAEKINETITIGIPTMKATIVLWMKLGEAEQAKQVNEAVERIIKGSLEQFAAAAAITVPAIAEAVQTPALGPDTVRIMAESIATQADGIVAALEHGRERRAALDQAMIEGKQIINAATDRVNDAQIQGVLDHALDSLQVATSVQG